MTYVSLFLSTLIASLNGLSKGFPSKKVYAFLCISIAFVVGLRYASTDYFGYLRIYEGIGDLSKFGIFIYHLSSSTPVESGFAALVILEKQFLGNYFAFIALFSFISLAIKFTAFKKLSPYLLLSLLIYLSDEYFWKDMGQIRNAMASGIILWAFYYAYLGRFWHFLILVLAAVLFHSAAIVALPFYFARWFKSQYFLATALLFSTSLVALVGGLGSALPELALYFGFDENSRLVKYAESQYVDGIRPFGSTFSLQVMVCLILIVFYRKLVIKWQYNQFFIPAYIYGSCLFFLFIDYGIIGSRIRDMLTVPVACVVFPSFVLLFRGYSKILPYSAIVLYCLVWFYMMTRDRDPYQSILQFVF